MTSGIPERDGIYWRIDPRAYHADRASLSSSGARTLTQLTPAEFRAQQLTPPDPKPQYDYGHGAHKMVLGEGEQIVPIAARDWRTKIAQTARRRAWDLGRVPLLTTQIEQAQRMAGKVFEHRLAAKLLEAGAAELSGYWHDAATGVRLRFRPDFLPDLPGRPIIVDYKGLALDTPLATPNGWTTVGSVSVGQRIFGQDGHSVTVTAKSEIHSRNCYRIRFDDSTSLICDDEHLWPARSVYDSRLTTPRLAAEPHRTDYLRANLRNTVTRQRHWIIPLADPLQLAAVHLPIDPYVYGCWLGDGTRQSGRITKPDAELFDLIAARGYAIGEPSPSDKCPTRTVYGLARQLRHAGLLGHRNMPDIFLRASAGQRLDLLRGLMDTDGSWNQKRKQAVFMTTDKHLAGAVYELAASLGERPLISTTRQRGFGLTVTAYPVSWRPQRFNPFALSRKANPVTVGGGTSGRRLIVAIDPTLTIPTQCLTVDAEDGCYLAGRQMVPTHNTAASAHPRRFIKSAFDYGYHQQAPWYIDGLAATTGAEDAAFLFIVQQKESPWLVSICQLEPDDVELGRQQNRRAIELYARCVESGRWPGYEGISTIPLPGYARRQIEDELEGNQQ